MKSLNEQLAVEVMGWEKRWEKAEDGYTTGYPEYRIIRDWNPVADMNQLRMCWKMLTQEQKATYKQLIVDHDVQSVFESPEQHAELILKAKGVI